MAIDATGTPTSLGIPKFNTAVDAPSGKGSNAQMDAIDVLIANRVLKPAGLAAGDVPVWNGTTFVVPGGTRDGTKFLRDDGSWQAVGGGLPPGAIVQYGAAAAPTGWVLCDGSSLLRTSPNDLLFAVIGVTYGNVDGTHFNVPDLRGRIPVGLGTNASVNALNTNDGQAVGNRRPQHRTSLTDPGHIHTRGGAGVNAVAGGGWPDRDITTGYNTGSSTTGITVGSGNANDALDTPSFIVVNYIIKL